MNSFSFQKSAKSRHQHNAPYIPQQQHIPNFPRNHHISHNSNLPESIIPDIFMHNYAIQESNLHTKQIEAQKIYEGIKFIKGHFEKALAVLNQCPSISEVVITDTPSAEQLDFLFQNFPCIQSYHFSAKLLDQLLLEKPNSIKNLYIDDADHLKHLYIEGCTHLERLFIKNSHQLRHIHFSPTTRETLSILHISDATELTDINFSEFTHLRELLLTGSPKQQLHLEGCSALYSLTVKHAVQLQEIYFPPQSCDTLFYLSLSYLPQLQFLDFSKFKRLRKLDLEHYRYEKIDLSQCFCLRSLSIKYAYKLLKIYFSEKVKKTLLRLHIVQTPYLKEHSDFSEYINLYSLSFKGYSPEKIKLSKNLSELYIDQIYEAGNIDFSGCKKLNILVIEQYMKIEINLSDCVSLRHLTIGEAPSLQDIDLSPKAKETLSSLHIEHAPDLRPIVLNNYAALKTIKLGRYTHSRIDLRGCMNLELITLIDAEVDPEVHLSSCVKETMHKILYSI
jgi:hypothetical protein